MTKTLPTTAENAEVRKMKERRANLAEELKATRERLDLRRHEVAAIERERAEAVAAGRPCPDTIAARDGLAKLEAELAELELVLPIAEQQIERTRRAVQWAVGDELLVMDLKAHEAFFDAVEAAQAAYDRLREIRQHAARELHGSGHPMAGAARRLELAQMFGPNGAVAQWRHWIGDRRRVPSVEAVTDRAIDEVWREENLRVVSGIWKAQGGGFLDGASSRRSKRAFDDGLAELADLVVKRLGGRVENGGERQVRKRAAEVLRPRLERAAQFVESSETP